MQLREKDPVNSKANQRGTRRYCRLILVVIAVVCCVILLACLISARARNSAKELSAAEIEARMEDYRQFVTSHRLLEDVVLADGAYSAVSSDSDSEEGLHYVKLYYDDSSQTFKAYVPSEMVEDLHIYFTRFRGIQFGEEETVYESGDSIPVYDTSEGKSVRVILWDDSVINMPNPKEMQFFYSYGTASLYLDTGDEELDVLTDKNEQGETAASSLASPYVVYSRENERVEEGDLSVEKSEERGSAYTQKPYHLTLSSGEERELLPDYVETGEQVRNKAALDLAHELNLSATAYGDFVNVYNHGTYVGLYLMTDSKKLSFESTSSVRGASTSGNAGTSTEVSWDEAPEAVRAYADWYNVLAGGKGGKSMSASAPEGSTLYQKLWDVLDQDSFVRLYLLEDFLCAWNGDFSVVNTRENGLLSAGKVWRYSLTAGYTSRQDYPVLALQTLWLANHFTPGDQSGIIDNWQSFLSALGDNPLFQEELVKAYNEEFRPLVQDYLEQRLPVVTYETVNAGMMNEDRYSRELMDANTAVWTFRQWLRKRLAFVDAYLASPDDYVCLNFTTALGNLSYYVKEGSAFGTLPVSGNGEGTTWYGMNGDYPSVDSWLDEDGNPLQSDSVITRDWEGRVFTSVSSESAE